MSWLADAWRRLTSTQLVISLDSVSKASEDRWPPTAADAQRLQDYDKYLDLYLGRHREVFDPYRRPDEGPYVAANVLGAISRLIAHRLFGEPARPRVKGRYEVSAPAPELVEPAPAAERRRRLKDLAREQELLDFLTQSNGWQQLCYQGALGGSYRGDAVYKVRYDAAADVVIIDEVPPSIYFPHIAPHRQDAVEAVSLAWVLGPETPSPFPDTHEPRHQVAWLREEFHTPGLIENRLWKLVATPGENCYVRRRVELSALEATEGLPESVATGLDIIPVVHIPNRKLAECGVWGQSDYADLEALQEALNRRKTQTGQILDKHADPLLAIDESFLDEQGRLPMDRVRAVPLVQDEPPPQYITWDGKLADSQAEAESLVEAILTVAGISPESLGYGQGSGAESGLAIRLRQMLTTSTVAGKRLQWEPGLQKLLSIASHMFVAHMRDKRRHGLAGARPLAPEEIGLEFGDGLPRDLSSAISDEVALQGGGLASKQASLHRLFPNWSEADVEVELARLGDGGS